jgi:salicylate hydroxylase
MNCWEIIAGHSLQEKSSVSFDNAIERFGKPVCTIHRVDLHNELLRLALDPPGGAKLYLSSSVVNINPEDGIIELADGSVHRGDLIVAADGLHSVARDLVVQAPTPPISTGLSAFRFLIPSEILENTPSISEIYHRKSKGVTIIPDVIDTANERHVVWYECRG